MTDRKLVLLFVFVVAFAANALIVPVPFTESPESTPSYRQDNNVVGTPSDLGHSRPEMPVYFEGELVPGPLKIIEARNHFRYTHALSYKRISISDVYSQGPPVI